MAATEVTFNIRGNQKQKEAARAWLAPEISEIVYGGSKGSGKSYLGVSLIFGDAFTYPETFYFIARKRLNDLRKYTLPSIYEVFQHWKIPARLYNYNGTDNYFQLHNGSRVYLIEADDRPSDPKFARFGSMQMTRGWIEEAGEVSLPAKNALVATVGRWKNDKYNLPPKVLQTCNPAKNYLYSDFYKPHREGTLDTWKSFIQALPQDNKMLPAGYLENLRRSLTNNEKERLLYGNWEYDDNPDALVDFDAITDCFTNDFIQPTPKNAALSLDLATKGRDRFIGAKWDNLRTPIFKGVIATIALDIPIIKAKGIEAAVRDLIRQYAVPRSRVTADSDGLGDFLESYITGIVEFHGNARAFNPLKYANLKTQCAYKLAELINNRQILIICTPEQRERLLDELACLIGVNTSDPSQKKQLISKDKMKELNGNKSPDYLDALIMGMIFLLGKAPAKGSHTAGYGKATDFLTRKN